MYMFIHTLIHKICNTDSHSHTASIIDLHIQGYFNVFFSVVYTIEHGKQNQQKI